MLLALNVTSGLVASRLWVSEPLLCLVVGIVAGPVVLGWVEIDWLSPVHHAFTLEIARITLCIAVTSAALRLPTGYLRTHWRELGWTLGVALPAMALIAAVLAVGTLGLGWMPALLIGAMLAPTDPVLSAPLVTGELSERLPARLRNVLTAESGANDGLASAWVALPGAALWVMHSSAPLEGWLQDAVLRGLLGALALGAAIGWLASQAFRWSLRTGHAERTALATIAVALALCVVGLAELLRTNAIFACFVAGSVFNGRLGEGMLEHQSRFNEAVARTLELPFFVLLGTALPWNEWRALGPAAVAFVIAVLLMRRLPLWLVLHRRLPSLRGAHEGAFTGWFGPIGIAAVYFALEWLQRVDVPDLWACVSVAVAGSVLLHGVTGTPWTRRLVRLRAQATDTSG